MISDANVRSYFQMPNLCARGASVPRIGQVGATEFYCWVAATFMNVGCRVLM